MAIAAAIPWIASAVGTMLPAIVDAFRSGKSPEEAQQIVAPQRQAMVERLIGSGMSQTAAEAMADEAMADEVAKAQLPEPMSPWLSAALAIGGGIGGYKLGKMATGRMTPAGADAAKAAKIDTPAEQALAKPASGQAPSVAPPAEPAHLGMEPQIKDAEVLSVSGRSPFPPPPMDAEFAALNMGGQVPGRATRRFTMPSSDVRGLPGPAAAMPEEAGMMGEIMGTPATASPFPASLNRSMGRAPMARSQQMSEAFGGKRGMEDQIRRMQMERDWEQQELLSRMAQ